MDDRLLEQLRQDAAIREALEESFDFIVAPPAPDVSEFTIEPVDSVEAIAGDAAGGVFLLYGRQQRVIYVSSEGPAGVVGRDVREFLTILMTYPYWFDLLKFSGGGKLDEMRQAVAPLEEDREELVHLAAHRGLLCERLGLRPDPNVIASLHDAVDRLSRAIQVVGPDGLQCGSLFNKFPAARLRRPKG